MKKSFVLFALASCINLNANAVEWVPLAESNNEDTRVYLDTDSVQSYTKRFPLSDPSSSYMSGFAQFTYLSNHKAIKQGHYYTKYYFIVNCDDNSYYTPMYNIYDVEDHVVSRYNDKHFSANDLSVAFPGTLASYVIKEICFFNS